MTPEIYIEPDKQTAVINMMDGKRKVVVQYIDDTVHLSLRKEHSLETIADFINGEASVCEVSRTGREVSTNIRLYADTFKAINQAVEHLKETQTQTELDL